MIHVQCSALRNIPVLPLKGYFRDKAAVVLKKPNPKSRLLFYLKPLSYIVSYLFIY